ncbi:thiamine pyrophosphate-binding protein [Burkholderia sp. WAC0059]|nr:thiamine pyrophosphate-binding protein [Burkholderia sp. WAC0059]
MSHSNTQTTLTGGIVLANALHQHGVDRIFCVPGESYLDVLDALYDLPDIEVVVAKHEGAAANMAEADGKLTGRPGICFVTRGPGATHGSIGVHIAQQDSTPMIMFIGQVPRGERGRDSFQEIDYAAMFGTIAKWVVEIDDPDRIEEIVARAFRIATAGRPGPVVISLPEDMLGALARPLSGLASNSVIANAPREEDIDAILGRLREAARPLVLLGGTGWCDEGLNAFRRFIERWDLPVAATFRHQDVLDNRSPNYVGHLGLGPDPKLAELVKQADLILAVGTRLGSVSTGDYGYMSVPYPAQYLVHVYPEQADIGRVFSPHLGLVTSSSAWALTMLARSPEQPPVSWSARTKEARGNYLQFSQMPPVHEASVGVNLARVVKDISETLPDTAVVANGAGNYTVWVHRFFAYKQRGTCLAPTNGSMGYGVPAAIAAKLRNPERDVIAFAGDGCFLMYAQELATAVQYRANIVVVVVNNGMYGTIRMHQEKRFPGRPIGTDLTGPDFVALATAFGAYAERVDDADAFLEALERTRSQDRPAVIELRTDPKQITPFMRIG